MTFLQNIWYIAAWVEEVAARPLGRRFLNRPVVLYRTEDGDVVALDGACPHRFAPLSLGHVIGDRIECRYHGLQFDPTGRCVHNPQGQGATPAALAVRRYPVVERHGAIWIWTGEPEEADPDMIPDFAFLEDDTQLSIVRGYMHSDAHYELLSDNIMDLGHVDFLHATTLGSPSLATARAQMTTVREGNAVSCNRWMANDVQGTLNNMLFDREGPVDAWIDVRWHPPALMTLAFGMTGVGAPREAGRETMSAHLMTPETDTSSHYFWAITRSFKHDPALDLQLYDGFTEVFTSEDKVMIEAQQQIMGTTDIMSLRPALLATDAPAVLARRIMVDLLAKEAKAASAT
jgi:phenylpropionate dioxygenase-like ring-hydroxylating dioxygenase large terminal subunit